MPAFTDQLDRSITLPVYPPRRIVSLVPSQTELLASLGLEEAVVGITKFCVRPRRWWTTKPRIGGTKQLHIDQIAALQPDLILANKEENVQEQVEALAAHFPVWVSDVGRLPEALRMIQSVGELCAREQAARRLIDAIQQQFGRLRLAAPPRLPAVYLIWRDPYMSVGGDTFISDMLERAGFDNLLGQQSRYPELTAEALRDLDPPVLLLSSEPYPFSEKHRAEFQALCPRAVICRVDGELFSWYGSRLRYAPSYFLNLQERILTELEKR